MSHLRWTASGAVAAPEALQVRVSARFDGRVSVGAPQPARSLEVEEVDRNVAWFTVARSGPRVRPVAVLVLSGVEACHEALAERVPTWRTWGVQRLVVHTTADHDGRVARGPLAALSDDRALVVRHPDHVDSAAPAGASVTLELNPDVLGALVPTLERVRRAGPRRLILTWPFPGPDVRTPVPAEEVVRVLADAGVLGSPDVAIKGLPPCVLGPSAAATPARTRNRWYVDADHQEGAALSFFPDLVRFARPDSCRACRWCDLCDGVADEWLARGFTGPLRPM